MAGRAVRTRRDAFPANGRGQFHFESRIGVALFDQPHLAAVPHDHASRYAKHRRDFLRLARSLRAGKRNLHQDPFPKNAGAHRDHLL